MISLARRLFAALTTAVLIIAAAPVADATARHHHRAPNHSEITLLATARHFNPYGACHLEWDGRWHRATAHRPAHWSTPWFEVNCAA